MNTPIHRTQYGSPPALTRYTTKARYYRVQLGAAILIAALPALFLFFPPTTWRVPLQQGWKLAHAPLANIGALSATIIHALQERTLDYTYQYSTLATTKRQAAATALRQLQITTATTSRTTTPTRGPLRVSTINPRYFADADGNLVYLTGSHTWSNFQDNGGADPPPAFDYAGYLDFLLAHHHNFFRLWTWEETRWTTETSDDDYWFDPAPPYQRTGPGVALDGKPKFDLTQFNQSYFDRMRERVRQAQARGIYVSIMLFDGWSISANKGWFAENNPWQGHPFNRNNNINNLDGDLDDNASGEEVHTLTNAAVTTLQETYVRKVIDTVSDLDNVLFEISNESDGGSEEWQYHMIEMIRAYEAGKPQQHPIGMTVTWPGGDNSALYASTADWISPNGDLSDPIVADGSKVVLLDTDHLCGICGDRSWVWKAFTRGHNPIFMDGYDGAGYGVGGAGFDFNDPTWVSLRQNLGYARQLANRVALAHLTPQPALATTGYCLAQAASPNAEYIVYLPNGGSTTVDLTAASGSLAVEWLNPATGATIGANPVSGGAKESLAAPFTGDAVLYLYQAQAVPTVTPTPTPIPTATRTLIPTSTPVPHASPGVAPTPTLASYRLFLPTTQEP